MGHLTQIIASAITASFYRFTDNEEGSSRMLDILDMVADGETIREAIKESVMGDLVSHNGEMDEEAIIHEPSKMAKLILGINKSDVEDWWFDDNCGEATEGVLK